MPLTRPSPTSRPPLRRDHHERRLPGHPPVHGPRAASRRQARRRPLRRLGPGRDPLRTAHLHRAFASEAILRCRRPAPAGSTRASGATWRRSILKALNKAPDQRYPTAQALADDLNHWLRYEPVSARPAAIPRRSGSGTTTPGGGLGGRHRGGGGSSRSAGELRPGPSQRRGCRGCGRRGPRAAGRPKSSIRPRNATPAPGDPASSVSSQPRQRLVKKHQEAATEMLAELESGSDFQSVSAAALARARRPPEDQGIRFRSNVLHLARLETRTPGVGGCW